MRLRQVDKTQARGNVGLLLLRCADKAAEAQCPIEWPLLRHWAEHVIALGLIRLGLPGGAR